MPLRIRVAASLADDLLSYLRGLGADARKQDARTIVVRRRHTRLPGEPAHQDEVELDFVVRGWAGKRRDLDYEIERAV